MFYALDDNGNRVSSFDAQIGTKYRCPICGNEVILKSGEINAPHFAHRANECLDTWHYDMSRWHIMMQECFPKEAREVIVTVNGVKHIADILINNTVIEFQHSPISSDEFNERNNFYKNAGYRVAWVFDLQEQFLSKQIEYVESDKTAYYRWRNPLRLFKYGPSISDYSKDFALWINGEVWSGEDNNNCILSKVVWTAKDDDGDPSLTRFIVSDCGDIDLKDKFDANEFFWSKKDKFYAALKNIVKDKPYQIKNIGEKGHPPMDYICPKTGKFGLKPFGEEACQYCKYCAIVSRVHRYDKNVYSIYCCYPNVMHDADYGHPEYECSSVDMFDL